MTGMDSAICGVSWRNLSMSAGCLISLGVASLCVTIVYLTFDYCALKRDRDITIYVPAVATKGAISFEEE